MLQKTCIVQMQQPQHGVSIYKLRCDRCTVQMQQPQEGEMQQPQQDVSI